MCVYTSVYVCINMCICVYIQVKYARTSREVNNVAGAQESTYFMYALYTCAYVCVYTYNTHAHMCVHRRTTHAHMCIPRHTIDMYQQGGKEHLRCASTRRAPCPSLVLLPAYVWHDSLICTTWLIQMCDLTQRDVWHDSCASLALQPALCVTWLIHMCDLTHSYVC